MVRLTLDRPHRSAGAAARASRTRRAKIVVRRGTRDGSIHVKLAGAASSVPRLMQALRAFTATGTAAVDPADTLRIFADSRVMTRGHQPVALTRREFDLLLFFVEHPRRVFTRRQLLAAVWGHEYGSERTVDVHIRRLRVKTGQPLVATMYRVGYRLHEDTVATVIREV
jgi:two-component system, OmpR family, response regulator MtrA